MPTLADSASELNRLGKKTTEAALRLVQTLEGFEPKPAFAQSDDAFYDLGQAFRGWSDEEASRVVDALDKMIAAGSDLEGPQVAQWVRLHTVEDDPDVRAEAVVDCIETKPPEHVTIIRRLSTAGSQKLVFLAKWQTTQNEIVLKRFRNIELAEKVIARELTAHALSLKHRNIIETHLGHNIDNEPFLLERRLPEVLKDSNVPRSIVEAANLLHDMADALDFLRTEELVHGDLKPDNIGLEHGQYILLDFGICRRFEDFHTSEATGSLRTRAPELLVKGDGHHGYASDVWALGATIFRGFVGRFPLFDKGENPPRIWEQPARDEFEAMLSSRVEKEYEERVVFDDVPEPIASVLKQMLHKDPTLRSSSKTILEYCTQSMSAVLRFHDRHSRLSPADEIARLISFLPDISVLNLMPPHERGELNKRLHLLEGMKGLTTEQKRDIGDLRRSRFPEQ